MTYEEFLGFVKGYDEFNECVNKLYNLGMMTEDCAIMEMYSYYAKAICKNFGADYAWFLNWADDKFLHVRIIVVIILVLIFVCAIVWRCISFYNLKLRAKNVGFDKQI